MHANVGATANLLDVARRRGWRFLLVSTGGVFQSGDPRQPIYEDARPDPTNVYGTTKYCAELLTRMYRKQFELDAATSQVRCTAQVETQGRTGVEMEALTAVQVGLLTVYDMCKAADCGMVMDGIRVLAKSGGKSGDWVADPALEPSR